MPFAGLLVTQAQLNDVTKQMMVTPIAAAGIALHGDIIKEAYTMKH